jgi:membrane fusion protein, multidrug efflux system
VGDHVKAGAPLARLDPQQPRADLAVAAATLASIRASLGRAQTELERERGLFAKDATPRATVDDREREVAVLTSRLTAAKARFDLAQEAVGDTELRAAHAGVVTAQDIEVGQPARQGVTVFTLADDGPRDAVFRVDENVAAQIQKGTSFTVESVDDTTEPVRVKGTVRELAPVLDRGTASVRVKVTLEGSLPKELALGSPVVASLAVSSHTAFLVPSSSVFSDPHEEPAVWIVDPTTHAVTLRRVVVQAYESDSVTLRGGVQDGDLVVTAGSHRLRPAQIVRLASANGEPS